MAGESRGLRSLYNTLPTNMRLLGEYLLGVDRPITQEDFKPEELEFIRNQVRQRESRNRAAEETMQGQPELYAEALDSYADTRGRTAITDPYSNGTGRGVVDQGYLSSLRKSFSDPQYNVATSLGKYVAEDAGKGGLRIQDTYDFNKVERNLPSGLGALKNMAHSPELLFEYLANAMRRSPREVDLYLEPPTPIRLGKATRERN